MSRKPRHRVAALVAVVVVGLAAGGCGSDERIADGVRIGTVNVGGLDAGTARERVQRGLAKAVRRPVVVTYRAQRFVLRPDLAGARVDAEASVKAAADSDGGTVAPRVSYDRGKVDGFVARVAKRVERPARDADIDVRDGKLSRTRARNGVEVKRAELAALLRRAVSNTTTARASTARRTSSRSARRRRTAASGCRPRRSRRCSGASRSERRSSCNSREV